MDEATEPYLEAFSAWLASLADDARAMAALAASAELPGPANRLVMTGLNYLLKSLDLIPDGTEDLGFIDDAFVLRATSSLALATLETPGEGNALAALSRLAADAVLIERFLGDDSPRLFGYVRAFGNLAARGRSVDELSVDPEARAALVADLEAWARSYEPPSFSRDPRTLVKLSSFLKARLPA